MERKFTKDDVIRYLYGEMLRDEEQLFLDSLVQDEDLWKEFEQMKEARDQLQQSELMPSESTLDKIRNAARKAVRRDTRRSAKNRVRFVSLHLVMAVVMVLFTASASLFAIYRFQEKSGMAVVNPSQPRLQWNDPYLDQRIQAVQYDIRNLSGQREIPVHLIHNTYQLVNVDQPSPCGQNVVLLDLR